MEYVSFRRAKDFPQMILPAEMIVEWQQGVISGYDSLPEDDFRIEYAKNEKLLEDWLAEKSALLTASAEAAKWSEVVSKQDAKLFQEWKGKRGKK